MTESTDTLYDHILRNLKNNKAAVAVLLLAAFLAGAAKITGDISYIRDFFYPKKRVLQVAASIERYDFMAGRTGSVESLVPITREITQMDDAANEVVKEIIAAIGRRSKCI